MNDSRRIQIPFPPPFLPSFLFLHGFISKQLAQSAHTGLMGAGQSRRSGGVWQVFWPRAQVTGTKRKQVPELTFGLGQTWGLGDQVTWLPTCLSPLGLMFYLHQCFAYRMDRTVYIIGLFLAPRVLGVLSKIFTYMAYSGASWVFFYSSYFF